MTNYKISKSAFNEVVSIMRQDNWFIPFDPANTDYANFKRDIEDGAELQDADGNVMTDAQEFVRSLP